MPASPYFLIAQVSLVALSAVAMKVGWTSQSPIKKPSKSPTAQSAPAASAKKPAPAQTTASIPKAIPFNPSAAVVDKLPAPEAPPRSALGKPEQAEAASNAIPSRSLGSRIGPSDEGQLQRVGTEGGQAEPSGLPELPLSNQPTDMAAYNIEADAATQMDLATQNVVFTGSVHLKSKRFALVADRLTVFMDPAQSTLRKLVANGHVQVQVAAERPEQAFHGTSNEAIYNPKDTSILLTGWPIIIGEGREHHATAASTQMTLFTDKPRLTTQGRASTLITGSMAAATSKAAEKK